MRSRVVLFAVVPVLVVSLAVTAVVLLSGGNDDEPHSYEGRAGHDSSASSTASATTSGESDDCELAARNWMSAARDQYVGAVMGTRWHDPDPKTEPSDRVEVYCSPKLKRAISMTSYEMALLNADLAICDTVPKNCDRRENNKQLGIVQRRLDAVQSLIDAA